MYEFYKPNTEMCQTSSNEQGLLASGKHDKSPGTIYVTNFKSDPNNIAYIQNEKLLLSHSENYHKYHFLGDCQEENYSVEQKKILLRNLICFNILVN